ncbi:MAG: hypothetical protein U0Q16_01225 [Bryobacteraceae bacterium]
MKTVPPVWAIAVAQEACLAALALAASRKAIPLTIGLVIATSLVYLVFVTSAWGHTANKSPRSNHLMLVCALGFRATLLPVAPVLSDDLNRYRWEGMVQAQGSNPYLLRPDDPAIPGRGFRSGYGPLTTALEWVNFEFAARLTSDPARQALWMKLPSVAFELATLLLLWRSDPARYAVYAWCPLPVVEFWWSGHNDAIAVFFVVAAVVAFRSQRWPWAFATLGCGVAAKWWPAVVWPLLARRRPAWSWIAALPVVLGAAWYVPTDWRQLIENARFMSGFVGGWRNNDSLFGLLLWLTGDQYLAKYAAFAILSAVVAWATRLRVEQGTLVVIVAMLLVSANCHPWYLTWIVPLLVWTEWWPAYVWMTLMPLTYTVLIDWYGAGVWNGVTASRWLVWIPFYASIAVWAVKERKRAD